MAEYKMRALAKKPWLILPAGLAHALSPLALKIFCRAFPAKPASWRPFKWRGLWFANPLGIAGGADKDALNLRDWQKLGAGFVEAGAVTPKPQKANPGKILTRSLKYRSLWNNMGFPNKGASFVRNRLSLFRVEERRLLENQAVQDVSGSARTGGAGRKAPEDLEKSFRAGSEGAGSMGAGSGGMAGGKLPGDLEKSSNAGRKSFSAVPRFPIFANIGKNRETPLSQALEDYKKVMEALHGLTDAFVINISSPNTEGLRGIFGEKALPSFLKALKAKAMELAEEQDRRSGPAIAETQAFVEEDFGKSRLGFPSTASKGIQKDSRLAKAGPAFGSRGETYLQTQEERIALGQEISFGLRGETPLILKLSPDEGDFARIIEQSLEAGIGGWCVCNSTKERAVSGLFPKRGGVSGRLLADKSLALLKELKRLLGDSKKDKLVISCGGVLTAENVLERLEEGADLVQVYSALVFEGPGFFRSVLKELSAS